MKKKIRIYKSDIKRAIKKTINEQYEMGDTYRRSPKHDGKYKKLPREKGIEGVFGVYGDEIPPAIVRYMRKNPKYIIQRLYDLYGKEVFDKYLPKDDYKGKMFSKGEFDDDFEMDFEEELIDEVTQMNVYDDPSNLTNDLETDKVKRGQTVGVKDNKGVVRTITVNESKKDLYKRTLKNRTR